MFITLLKKQFTELFKGFFFDAKKNRLRPKWAIALWIVFFVWLVVGVGGGMFTFLSLAMCESLTSVGMGWFYFLLMSGFATVLGAFGSVFSTYSGLYLAKDNDLLLAMPIPTKTIVAARLTNVCLMGTLYSAIALVPALAVYWATVGAGAVTVICGVMLFVGVSLFVLILSCVLGRAVAGIAVKLKNKSFFTVIIALLFLVGYYVVYFKAGEMIKDVIRNAEILGEKIRGAAYVLYLFGRIGEGDLVSAAVFFVSTAALAGAVWLLLSKSFLRLATAKGKTSAARGAKKRMKEKSAFAALLGREFRRFSSSPNYMLNCGLGTILIPAGGIALLIKGKFIFELLNKVLPVGEDVAAVVICAALCMLSSMNDSAAPSVSLEGKTLWIVQSLPVEPKTALRAKLSVQMILTAAPMAFASACAAAVADVSVPLRIMVFAVPVIYSVFSAFFDLTVGVRLPILNWTNELAPIKQSASVAIALFGGWGICASFAGTYLLVGRFIGATAYLILFAVLLGALSFALKKWLDTKGAKMFSEL